VSFSETGCLRLQLGGSVLVEILKLSWSDSFRMTGLGRVEFDRNSISIGIQFLGYLGSGGVQRRGCGVGCGFLFGEEPHDD
jgi:hypothetical protein